MASVRKIASLAKIAEDESLHEKFMKTVKPDKGVKLDIGKEPKWKYQPVRKEYPGEPEKTIDLTKDLAPKVREYLQKLTKSIDETSKRIKEIEKQIKEREKRWKEKDTVWQKLEKEKKTLTNDLFVEAKDLMEKLAQFKATNVRQIEEVEETKAMVERIFKAYYAEVPTGRITQEGLKEVLKEIEKKFQISIDNATQQELLIKAMGKQFRVVITVEENIVENAPEATPEGGERTASLYLALNWTYFKEKAEQLLTTLKNAFSKAVEYAKKLLGIGQKTEESIKDLNASLAQLAQMLGLEEQ